MTELHSGSMYLKFLSLSSNLRRRFRIKVEEFCPRIFLQRGYGRTFVVMAVLAVEDFSSPKVCTQKTDP